MRRFLTSDNARGKFLSHCLGGVRLGVDHRALPTRDEAKSLSKHIKPVAFRDTSRCVFRNAPKRDRVALVFKSLSSRITDPFHSSARQILVASPWIEAEVRADVGRIEAHRDASTRRLRWAHGPAKVTKLQRRSTFAFSRSAPSPPLL